MDATEVWPITDIQRPRDANMMESPYARRLVKLAVKKFTTAPLYRTSWSWGRSMAARRKVMIVIAISCQLICSPVSGHLIGLNRIYLIV